MMNSEEVLYLAPYAFSLLLSLGIFLYTWRHHHVRGARIYAWFIGGQTLTILGFIFELISPTLEIKIFWDKFQWLTTTFLVILPFLIFSIRFSEHQLRYPALSWGIVVVFLIIFTALLLTDSVHHLFYPNPHVSTDYPFPELKYDFTFVVYVYALFYVYGVNFYGISLLIKRAFQPHNLYRRQYLTITAGLLIPLVLSFFTLAGIKITPQRDTTPFAFAIGNLFVAWGLFRYGLFDIAPIARERIVENMSDPVIVLDPMNRIVDINRAALTFIGKQSSEVIGRTSSAAFAKWPFVVELLNDPFEQSREVSTTSEGDTLFFDLSISPIFNRRQELLGRIVVARDITRRKTLEISYRILSEELEQRVRERTEELRNSAERYRAVVENQTEFIVRWKPNGTRTFVNEAYCRYWGVTYEQGLAFNFLFHIVEEDRPVIEEKISRLHSGAVEAETEIHRVIRPNGSIAWQEWTDQAIRDEWGKLIEIQSVGRDITERKLVEESLLKQLAFDELLTRLLTRFATCAYDEVDASIEIGLKEIAEFMGADYADVLILSQDQSLWSILQHWVSPHLSKVIHPAQEIPLGLLSWSENKLLRGEPIKINTFDDYPPEAMADRRFSEAEGAKSLLSVPIQGLDQQAFGCIDLLSYTHQINWSDSDTARLKMIGDAIANLLERKRAEENLAEAYDTTLEGWAKALELRDKETEGHSRRVTETTSIVAHAMGFGEAELIHIRRGSILHDIGKMGVSDDILRKNGSLTENERMVVEKHPDTAYELLKGISFLEKALEIPRHHHEKWDGTGYPRRLKGNEIPLPARIFAVADVWDALTTDRPYRKAWPREQVTQYLVDESGKHFDPKVVEIFLQLLREGKI